ncbi:glycoside hydrolase family 32 protein [Hymenobacter persicinus]|uniref:Glycoside hydrolase family 32 protein n=1 Tax=Hymenobacter persicinus TaxID=2025506 RepID=A0A4Q5LEE2_9BACT|nr:glycoside hydrolase family 32 protein [Hymenobacter persicinus]RYU82797.1 glycoside hydrolase family 32 protein [Hymenobacter persicinus]
MKKTFLLALSLAATTSLAHAQATAPVPPATPQYRPAYHFSPAAHWMNDPNGMVYSKGVYHLFFQHYPDGMVWGPMHWGHATSPDLLTWQEQPIALFPDSLGYIFSGSVVIDANNTAGFGPNAMVAIFTHHDPVTEKLGTNKHQNQSLAYSLDEGKTWTKYQGNPVLKNPGIQDFRDPKVSWHAATKKWVMTLATKDCITFYSSSDLKSWAKESEFGATLGAHGGVWECPDLFPLTLNGQTHWVLIVNLNPGAPNGGSGTQYFVGRFDGHTFTPSSTTTKWADYGPDDYAGVTYHNTGSRRIFQGWMSNWDYSNQVPTSPWRNAMTVPRELGLQKVGAELYLTSRPVPEVSKLARPGVSLKTIRVQKQLDLTPQLKSVGDKFELKLTPQTLTTWAVVLSNSQGEELVIGFDKPKNEYYIDRRKAGKTDFNTKFAGRHTAPRLATGGPTELTLLVDASSVELFTDQGLTVMTSTFFPSQPLNKLQLRAADLTVTQLRYAPLAGK